MTSKVSQLETSLNDVASKNIKEIVSLMEFFVRETNKSPEFVQVLDEIKSLRLTVSNVVIISYTSVYFLRFKEDIKRKDVEKLLNFDYTSLIEEDTVSDTDQLIRRLIDSIKNVWLRGNSKTQNHIKSSIFKMLKYSMIYKNVNDELEKS